MTTNPEPLALDLEERRLKRVLETQGYKVTVEFSTRESSWFLVARHTDSSKDPVRIRLHRRNRGNPDIQTRPTNEISTREAL